MLKRLLDKARKAAEERLPADVLEAGRRLRDRILEHAPEPVAEAVARYVGTPQATEPDIEPQPAPSASGEGAARPPEPSEVPAAMPRREDPAAVLSRVKTKAAKGLKPEDRLVVIYATADERDAVAEIRAHLDGIETTIREVDLTKEPQTRKQIERLSGVMVPPYVFVNGRYWGTQFEIAALAATGDLERVVAHRLDELGPEARRIGKLRETFSDAITVENILERWKLGHILTVDDLDAWYEVDRDGTERFYYQGGPRPVEDMESVAHEIVAAVENEGVEATWHLEPAVSLG